MIDTLVAHEVLSQDVPQFVRIPTNVVDTSNVKWHEAVLREALAANVKY